MDGGAGDDQALLERTNLASGLVFVPVSSDVATVLADGTSVIHVERFNVQGSSTGNDSLAGLGASDTLVGWGGDDTLRGNAGGDYLRGVDGNDVLDGGAGNDTMIGGGGNDTYRVTDAGDVTDETLDNDGGRDLVQSWIDWTLGTGIEKLMLMGRGDLDGTGNDLDNRITGTIGMNLLSGAGGDDLLIADDGADTLDGGSGADTMKGGDGDDLYFVDDAGDVVIEPGAGSSDTVMTSSDWVMGDHVELLVLTGSAGLVVTGNAQGNLILGNAGSDVLDGGGGNDTLVGGSAPGAPDTMVGGDGADSLVGGVAGDLLVGGAGSDTMAGGGGFDSFRYDAPGDGVDTVLDFAPGEDLFEISSSGFGGVLDEGPLAAANFALDAASGPGPQFVYHSATGLLVWDANGDAAGGVTKIAKLVGAPAIGAGDFEVFG